MDVTLGSNPNNLILVAGGAIVLCVMLAFAARFLVVRILIIVVGAVGAGALYFLRGDIIEFEEIAVVQASSAAGLTAELRKATGGRQAMARQLETIVLKNISEGPAELGYLDAIKKYNPVAFEGFVNSIVADISRGSSFDQAISLMWDFTDKMRSEAVQDSSDSIIIGAAKWHKDIFETIADTAPSACSQYLIGRRGRFDSDKASKLYQAMLWMLFHNTSASSPSLEKTTVSEATALEFAETLWGAERFHGVMTRTAPTRDVCLAMGELYGAIMAEEYPRSAALMRRWASPERFFDRSQ